MKTSFAGIATMCCLVAGVVGCFMCGQPDAAHALIAVLVGQFIPPPVVHHEGEP